MRSTDGRARAELRGRLEARREEIEAAALTRVRAIADPAEVSDPAYAEGLRAAVAAAVAYGIETTGREASDPPVPVALLAQARLAARARIPLDTVLRRYFAGYSLLGYFILEEAGNAGLTDGAELKRLLGAHAGIFDRLLAAVGEEHGREAALRAPSLGHGRAETIERLLAGEMVDTAGIDYDFEGWHVGVVAEGADAEQRLRGLVARYDGRLLLLHRGDGAVWAWLGARRQLDPTDLLQGLDPGGGRPDPAAPTPAPASGERALAIAVGEPGEELAGWRLTHHQALAALGIAKRGPERAVRYADVALRVSALQDELLTRSLRQLYLRPLAEGRDGGALAHQTLRAYFAAGRNAASAAAVLGVTPQAVNSRLRGVEERVGRPLSACAAELEVALGIGL